MAHSIWIIRGELSKETVCTRRERGSRKPHGTVLYPRAGNRGELSHSSRGLQTVAHGPNLAHYLLMEIKLY